MAEGSGGCGCRASGTDGRHVCPRTDWSCVECDGMIDYGRGPEMNQ